MILVRSGLKSACFAAILRDGILVPDDVPFDVEGADIFQDKPSLMSVSTKVKCELEVAENQNSVSSEVLRDLTEGAPVLKMSQETKERLGFAHPL